MKKNPSFKNMLEILLAVYLISWGFFGIIIWGKNYDIFSYASPEGRLVAVIAEVIPAVIVYVYMTVWQDVSSFKHFIKKVLDGEQPKKIIMVLSAFVIVHSVIVIISGTKSGRSFLYLPAALVIAFISYGVAEIAWRGIIFSAFWEHMPFFTACMLSGVMHTIYFLPMYKVEGAMKGEFAWFMFFCIFQAILLGCLYRITHCTAACIVMETVIRIQMYFYTDLVFGSARIIMCYLIELAAACIAAFTLGTKVPGRGWVNYERDDFK